VLFVLPEPRRDGRMRMFNPDGSEAEMCGNGLRLVGRYLAERQDREAVEVATARGSLRVRRLPPLAPGVPTYEAEIGPVSFAPASLPMVVPDAGSDAGGDAEAGPGSGSGSGPTSGAAPDDTAPDGTAPPSRFVARPLAFLPPGLRWTALSVPNPHLVAVVARIDEAALRTWGGLANAHPLFPQGVNVSLVQALGPGAIFCLTYERGVGITNSCGTAMSASTLVAATLGLVPFDTAVEVWNKGGRVCCRAERDPDGECRRIWLAGNATWLWRGAVRVALAADGGEAAVAFAAPPTPVPMEPAAYAALKVEAVTRRQALL